MFILRNTRKFGHCRDTLRYPIDIQENASEYLYYGIGDVLRIPGSPGLMRRGYRGE